MCNKDIRWIQRFENFKKALSRLSVFVEQKDLNELEQQGLIKAFEYTFELGWNTLKDYYEYQGETGIQGSRDAIQLAFKRSLIIDGDSWMRMLADRNRTAHTYHEAILKEIVEHILKEYFNQFKELKERLDSL